MTVAEEGHPIIATAAVEAAESQFTLWWEILFYCFTLFFIKWSHRTTQLALDGWVDDDDDKDAIISYAVVTSYPGEHIL